MSLAEAGSRPLAHPATGRPGDPELMRRQRDLGQMGFRSHQGKTPDKSQAHEYSKYFNTSVAERERVNL